MDCVRVAVIGATGYVGIELIRLLLYHSSVEIKYLCAGQSSGVDISASYSHFPSDNHLFISDFSDINFNKVDVVFLCLPHNKSQELILRIPNKVKVIDLSADFRINDVDIYEKWYGNHQSANLIKSFVYGLTEVYREEIKAANFIACPGCYATSILIPMIPLLRSKLIKSDEIIVDAKSGVSGAGKVLNSGSMFCEVNESIKVYSISNHRHIPEIEQELCKASEHKDVFLQFTPNLIPVNRGILSSIYVRFDLAGSLNDIKNELINFYKNSVFVCVNDGRAVSTRSVIGTNICYLGVFAGRRKNTAVIVSVIDNLLKGASGQALQNFNVMSGFPEETGLTRISHYP